MKSLYMLSISILPSTRSTYILLSICCDEGGVRLLRQEPPKNRRRLIRELHSDVFSAEV